MHFIVVGDDPLDFWSSFYNNLEEVVKSHSFDASLNIDLINETSIDHL
jgi:hypothetical protein